jgi:hypothetical protein
MGRIFKYKADTTISIGDSIVISLLIRYGKEDTGSP